MTAPWTDRRRAALVGAAIAASLVVALAPAGAGADRDPRPGPTLLAHAEGAIAPRHDILVLSIRIDETWPGGDADSVATTHWREWSLAGTGRAMLLRGLITAGRLDRPPTDEDTTQLTDRDGRVIDERSWTRSTTTPGGRVVGELEIRRPMRRPERQASLVGQLRDAYRRGELRPRGTAVGRRLVLDGGDVIYRDAEQCVRTEVTLDPWTFVPRTVEINEYASCRPRSRVVSRELWTIAARSLPATAANRRLLEVGDWPTVRVTRRTGATIKPLARVPPVPPLDEG